MTDQANSLTASTGETGTVERSRPGPVYTPVTDIDETKDALIVRADIPGADPATVSVSLDRDVLRLTAQVRPPAPEGTSLVHAEYRTGDYERSFVLTVDVNPDRIDARIKDGVLTIVLPKAEPAPARKISVRTA